MVLFFLIFCSHHLCESIFIIILCDCTEVESGFFAWKFSRTANKFFNYKLSSFFWYRFFILNRSIQSHFSKKKLNPEVWNFVKRQATTDFFFSRHFLREKMNGNSMLKLIEKSYHIENSSNPKNTWIKRESKPK